MRDDFADVVRLAALADEYCRKNASLDEWELAYYRKQQKPAQDAPSGRCEHCNGLLLYVRAGHDLVCEECGVATYQSYEELGDTRQYEQRLNCAPLTAAHVEYNRNKHFRKVLRDITFMPIRVPKHLLDECRQALGANVTVARVRAFLRRRKLFHYYTVANCIAHQLGDKSKSFKMNSAAYLKMCGEADALSRTFDRLRGTLLNRKNFVNVQVLILHIARKKFNMPEIQRVLRLPRERTLAKHLEVLEMLEAHR